MWGWNRPGLTQLQGCLLLLRAQRGLIQTYSNTQSSLRWQGGNNYAIYIRALKVLQFGQCSNEPQGPQVRVQHGEEGAARGLVKIYVSIRNWHIPWEVADMKERELALESDIPGFISDSVTYCVALRKLLNITEPVYLSIQTRLMTRFT